ncbi:oligopeptide/dipeptide ABC transporter ATP-binding protein [Nocardioides yefusunii]|uniref:Oligopeptide/dipeptide ABC transporter ATP-binding protein n=1 Tax=Nocardioides yefusunii TaxID=2500546 RepID=A0ABW1R0X9_9ACTN|nr:oligopeptide/dipeptide ABC transporter ATP-binding protein [Nocardioides yefusunii]
MSTTPIVTTDATVDTALVQIDGLVKHYPLTGRRKRGEEPALVHALDGITLDVPRGRSLALIGESGCGKSTVAKLLVGLTTPTSGSVKIAGHEVVPVTTHDPAARRRVQLVSQNPWSALNRARTVEHILAQPLTLHGGVSGKAEIRRRAGELLEMVGLPANYLSRRPRDMSGGELQRVTVARALAGEPDVLVLDEPTASLDVSVKATLVNLLSDLRARLGLTYVLITHELDIARHLADDVAVMYLGEIVERGPSERVFTAPEHPYTRALLAAAPTELVIGKLHGDGLTGEVPSAIDPPAGCRFHTRCPFATDECTTTIPPALTRPDARVVACLRTEELAATLTAGAHPTERNAR